MTKEEFKEKIINVLEEAKHGIALQNSKDNDLNFLKSFFKAIYNAGIDGPDFDSVIEVFKELEDYR